MVSARTVLFSSMLTIVSCCGSICAQSAAAPRAYASDTAVREEYHLVTEADIRSIRKGIRSLEKQVIAANMTLTDAEAEKFWPVYDKYISELDQIDDTKYALIKQDIDTGGVLSDTDAEDVATRWVEIDHSVAQLRLKYIPSFRRVLSSRKMALFCQLERHVQLTIDERLASSLPIIEP